MNQIAGHCGKCGAPYSYPLGTWVSIFPQPPIPTCTCWSTRQIYTTTDFKLHEAIEHGVDCWKEHHECAINRITKIQSSISLAAKKIASEPPSDRRDCLLIIFTLLLHNDE